MSIEEKERDLGFLVTGAAFGAAMGVVAGVIMGVLFAPKSGQETRAGLAGWLKEKRERGGELLSQLREESLHRKEQVAAAIKAGRQAYTETTKHG